MSVFFLVSKWSILGPSVVLWASIYTARLMEPHYILAGTWVLGSFTVVLAPVQSILQQQNTKKLYRTKNNCMHVWLSGIMNNKIQKGQKANCHFWGAESRSKVRCMIPALGTTNGMGGPLKPPLWPYPLIWPFFTPFKEPAQPSLRASKGSFCFHFDSIVLLLK